MQVSADSAVKFISAGSGKRKDGEAFFFVNLLDEKQNDIRCFCDAEVWGQVSKCSLGDEITPVFDVYAGKSGLGVRLRDFIKPSHV